MPFYRILRLFLLCLLWVQAASSQKYPGKNYTAASELPNNTVRSLLVDSNNFLWIGTDNGVVKKENDRLQYFFEEDGLALNSCWAIAEDKNNRLWFGSYGEGVSIYDGFEFRVLSEKDGLVHNEITSLFSHENLMYVGTSDGVSVIDVDSFQVYSPKIPSGNGLFRIQDFFIYRDQVYVATYSSGVYRIQNKDQQPALVKVNSHEFIYSVLVDQDSIYSSNKGFYTKSALADYVKEGVKISEDNKLGTSIIWDHVITDDDRIFAAAWGIYDSDGGLYELTDEGMISRAAEFNVPSREVISLAYDPTFEKLYAGTRDAGLFEIALKPKIKFHEIPGSRVLGFARTANTSAVLRNDGILIIGEEAEEFISLPQLKAWQENYVRTTPLPLPKHRDGFYELDYSTGASDIHFYDIKAFGNTYWINTNIGLFAIDSMRELQRYLPLHSEEINFTPAGDLIETNPYGGVRVYSNPDSLKYAHFWPDDPHTPTMVVGSLQHEDRTYFVSVFSGLYVWENNGFSSYLANGTWKEKKLRHITALGENLAISTEFGDVYIISDEDSFRILEKIPRAKIRGNSISFLRQYDGNLLIGTEKGLNVYKDRRSIILDKEQGLEQPLLSAVVKDEQLFIGSTDGYYIVDLKSVTDTEALVTQLKIEEIFVNNSKLPIGAVGDQEKLSLAHDENTILLKFGTNAHAFPNKLKYQYRLNESEAWSLPSSKPEIFLPFLPAEDYEITVKVTDESTGLSHTEPLLRLSILPPFWKTWWFILLIISLGILGVYALYKIQIRQHRKFEAQKGLIQKRFEETKMEALLAQMNPHFIFNAMSSIQYYIMDSDIDNATKFLGDFAKLIRLNLDHCTKPSILLLEEIEYLQLYTRVENTRFNDRISVLFEVDPEIDTYEVRIPAMLLQTFVENVFVHAFPPSIPNPTLKISFELLSEDVLQCKVEDNGIGISESPGTKLHQSKGVTLVRERLSLLGYNVDKAAEIISAPNKGTTVILRLRV